MFIYHIINYIFMINDNTSIIVIIMCYSYHRSIFLIPGHPDELATSVLVNKRSCGFGDR